MEKTVTAMQAASWTFAIAAWIFAIVCSHLSGFYSGKKKGREDERRQQDADAFSASVQIRALHESIDSLQSKLAERESQLVEKTQESATLWRLTRELRVVPEGISLYAHLLDHGQGTAQSQQWQGHASLAEQYAADRQASGPAKKKP